MLTQAKHSKALRAFGSQRTNRSHKPMETGATPKTNPSQYRATSSRDGRTTLWQPLRNCTLLDPWSQHDSGQCLHCRESVILIKNQALHQALTG